MKKIWEGPIALVDDVMFDNEDLICDDIVIEEDEEHAIIINGYFVRIPELKLRAYEGVFYVRDESGELQADFALSMLFEDNGDDEDTSEHLYWEQDGINITLANYLHRDFTLGQIQKMACELWTKEPAGT